jgi:nicotinamidase-related amidase
MCPTSRRSRRHCLENNVPGRRLAELLQPANDDYFVLKPAHSGFYSTTLEVLLKHLEAHTLIITGLATNNCVQFTAGDAFLRGFRLVVPSDCVAANSPRLSREALAQMRLVLKASTPRSTSLRWNELRTRKTDPQPALKRSK